MLSSGRAPRAGFGRLRVCKAVSDTAVGNRSRRDGGRRSRPRKSWRFIGVSCRSSSRTSTPPHGNAHQTVQRRLDLEGFSRSSREMPVNTVKAAANSNIEASKHPALLNMTKEKPKFDQVSPTALPGARSGETKTCASKRAAFPSCKPFTNRFECARACFDAHTDCPRKVIAERWRANPKAKNRDRVRSVFGLRAANDPQRIEKWRRDFENRPRLTSRSG